MSNHGISINKIVKICGLKTEEAAQQAITSGANLVGIILVPNRARTIDHEQAKIISKLASEKRKALQRAYPSSKELFEHLQNADLDGPDWFKYSAQVIAENGPFLVGVFRNQPVEQVAQISKDLNLDFVQLHGSENIDDYIQVLDVPVIPRFVLHKSTIKQAIQTKNFLIPLLDSEAGGEGKVIDWDDAKNFHNELGGAYLLAGGLTPENVRDAMQVEGCLGVDVSGGVETDGVKDLDKIHSFLQNARDL